MSISRRELFEHATSLGVVLCVLPSIACNTKDPRNDTGDTGDTGNTGLPVYTYDGPLGPKDTFAHGVASGDPLQDAVLLWTHVSTGELEVDTLEVFLEVALDPEFIHRIAANGYTTDTSRGHTLTVDATELPSETTVYYRFSALGRTSATGRSRTAPGPDATHVRLAACACSNYGYGYFHAYKHLAARRDIHAVLHLGDYIYEYASEGHGRTYGTARELDPLTEMISLDDYRRRYAHYRRDPDLLELHRQHPIIHVWDDHEFTNDPYPGGAQNHDDGEGDWSVRVENALQAYSEWMPTRLRGANTIYRSLNFGLVQILMLDRQRRFLWPEDGDDHYLGRRQANWVTDNILSTTAPWLLLGQGTTFAPRNASGTGGCSWDSDSRGEVLDAVAAAGIDNLLVLTGDIHKFDALDIVHDKSLYADDKSAGSAGVEWIAGSVSSPGSSSSTSGVPQFYWSDGSCRGYCVIDITPERAQADFYGFADILKYGPIAPEEAHLKSFVTWHGTHHQVEATAPVPTDEESAPLAP